MPIKLSTSITKCYQETNCYLTNINYQITVKVNNSRLAAILNLDELNFFKMHPLLKPYNLFYSNAVDILSGFHDIPQYQACRGE